MEIKTKLYLKKKFQEYYLKHYIPFSAEIEKREFGIGNLEKKIAFRHRSFKSEKELNKYLQLDTPFYISYSAAYYEFPEAEMHKKNFLGADLIFDFDVEDFFKNFEKLKQECIKLLDFLKNDFGFKNIKVNFSGSKGFHIKVFDEKVKKIDKDGRIEILDYITANGLDIKNFFRVDKNHSFFIGLENDKGGWGKRIKECAEEILKNMINDKKTGQEKREYAKKIMEEIKDGNYKNFDIEITQYEMRRRIENKAIKLISDADRAVSQDITRLIRLENSLHGGTGFIAKIVDIEKFKLENFSDVIAFSKDNEVEISLNEDINFWLLENYNLKKGTHKLPEYVAIYLLLKNKGELKNKWEIISP